MTNEDAQDKNGRRRSGVRKRLDFIRSWSSVGQEKRRRRKRRKKRRRRRNLGFVVVLVHFSRPSDSSVRFFPVQCPTNLF